MKLIKLVIKACIFLAYIPNAFSENQCGVDIYESFIDYRFAINNSISPLNSKEYYNYDFLLSNAESHFKNSLIKKFFFTKNDVRLKAEKNIERMNYINRDMVGVESYFAVCREGYGEIFLKSVSADTRYNNESITLKNVKGKWLINNFQLFNYSEILNKDIIFERMPEKFISVYKSFLNEDVAVCLSKLVGTEMYYKDNDKYYSAVNECY